MQSMFWPLISVRVARDLNFCCFDFFIVIPNWAPGGFGRNQVSTWRKNSFTMLVISHAPNFGGFGLFKVPRRVPLEGSERKGHSSQWPMRQPDSTPRHSTDQGLGLYGPPGGAGPL